MDHEILADFMSSIRDKKKKQSLNSCKIKMQNVSVKSNAQKEASENFDGSDSRSEGEKSIVVGKGNSDGGINVTKGENRSTPSKLEFGADGHIVKAFNSSMAKSSSRLRPRKELPVFRKVELKDGDNEKIVGKRIKVYWSGSKRWFSGCIKSFDGTKRLHKIHYVDGEKEDLNLSCELFELELFPRDGFTLKTKPINVKRKKSFDRGEGSSEISQENLDDAGCPRRVDKKTGQKEKAYKMVVEKSSSTNPERKGTEGEKKNDNLSTEKDMKTHSGNTAGGVEEVKSLDYLDDSEPILEVGTAANEAVELPTTRASDVKKEIGKAVRGDPVKADVETLKTYVRKNERGAQRYTLMSISMLERGKETKLPENRAGYSLDVANKKAKCLRTDTGFGIHKSKEEVAGENHIDSVTQKMTDAKAVGK